MIKVYYKWVYKGNRTCYHQTDNLIPGSIYEGFEANDIETTGLIRLVGKIYSYPYFEFIKI